MKAQRRFGLALSWPRVTTVFLVDVLILLAASHCPESWQGEHRVAWWVGVGLAGVVTLLSLVSYRGITVVSGLVSWLWDWSADPGTALGAGCTPAVDFQRRFGRDPVGVREYRGRLVSVIAVDGGFLSVTEETVTVLAESAEFESEIDESAAKEDSESDDPRIAARGRARLRAVGAID